MYAKLFNAKSLKTNIIKYKYTRKINFYSNFSSGKTNDTIVLTPAYNFKDVIENIDKYKESCLRRELDKYCINNLDKIKEIYNEKIQLIKKSNEIQRQRNLLNKQMINVLSLPSKEEILVEKQKLISNGNNLKIQNTELEKKISEFDKLLLNLMNTIPNLIDPSVKNEVEQVDFINSKDLISANEELRDHVRIANEFKMIDLKSASISTGSSWYYLTGYGAKLELALINYAIDKVISKGWNFVIPPSVVHRQVAAGAGFNPRDKGNENQIYSIENSDLVLTGTAEIALAAMGINKTFITDKTEINKQINLNNNNNKLNSSTSRIRFVGVNKAYRAEAGSTGRETRGLYRVHEFTKVELFAWTATREEADLMLEEILSLQKEIISELGLSARVLNMPANDLGAPAYKKYDIEAWMPGKNAWGELTSSSNCLQFQSRRLGTTFKIYDKEKGTHTKSYAYTLNGTAMAVPRVIVALLENYYNPEHKRIYLPKVLHSYMKCEYISSDSE